MGAVVTPPALKVATVVSFPQLLHAGGVSFFSGGMMTFVRDFVALGALGLGFFFAVVGMVSVFLLGSFLGS